MTEQGQNGKFDGSIVIINKKVKRKNIFSAEVECQRGKGGEEDCSPTQTARQACNCRSVLCLFVSCLMGFCHVAF